LTVPPPAAVGDAVGAAGPDVAVDGGGAVLAESQPMEIERESVKTRNVAGLLMVELSESQSVASFALKTKPTTLRKGVEFLAR
jgi:hypothetical protein